MEFSQRWTAGCSFGATSKLRPTKPATLITVSSSEVKMMNKDGAEHAKNINMKLKQKPISN